MRLSTYFSSNELKCKGSNCCGGVFAMNEIFMHKLNALRMTLGVPLHVSSGFRCYTHNKRINNNAGGHPRSKHCRGMAADVYTERYTPTELAAIASNMGLFEDVIPNESRGYTHIEI